MEERANDNKTVEEVEVMSSSGRRRNHRRRKSRLRERTPKGAEVVDVEEDEAYDDDNDYGDEEEGDGSESSDLGSDAGSASSEESSEESDVEPEPLTLVTWSPVRSEYAFEEFFSEAMVELSRRFVLKLVEVDALTPRALRGAHLLFLQGGERRALAHAEQRALVEFIQKGGSVIGNCHYPHAHKARRKAVEYLLALFGLKAVKKKRMDPDAATVRQGFWNRRETRFQERRTTMPYGVGPWVPLFEPKRKAGSRWMRVAYLPRGSFGLGQVLLVSNIHCFADVVAWKGGLFEKNAKMLVNFARTSSHKPPYQPRFCLPDVILAAIKGRLSNVIRAIQNHDPLELPDIEQTPEDEDDDDEDELSHSRFQTAAHAAAGFGHVDILQYLVEEENVRPDFQQSDMRTPVHMAAGAGSIEALVYLVRECGGSLDKPDCRGLLPIHVAARGFGSRSAQSVHNRCDAIRFMVNEMGMDKDIPSTVSKATPLFAAVASTRPHQSMVEFLLSELKCDIDRRNADGWHALLVAANNHTHANIVQMLVAAGVDPCTVQLEDGQTALHRACLNGHMRVVTYLGETFPELLERVDANGYTCLHFAARGGHAEVLEWLLDAAPEGRRASLTAVDAQSKNVFHVAAIHNRLEVAQFLLVRQPGMHRSVTRDGWSPLMFAVRGGHVPMIELLCKVGSKINAKTMNPPHDTALLLAMKHGLWNAAEMLLAAPKIDVSLSDEHGWTALHLAVETNAGTRNLCPTALVRRLIEHGADPYKELKMKNNKKKSEGWTPLTLATHRNRRDIISVFLDVKKHKGFAVMKKKKKKTNNSSSNKDGDDDDDDGGGGPAQGREEEEKARGSKKKPSRRHIRRKSLDPTAIARQHAPEAELVQPDLLALDDDDDGGGARRGGDEEKHPRKSDKDVKAMREERNVIGSQDDDEDEDDDDAAEERDKVEKAEKEKKRKRGLFQRLLQKFGGSSKDI